MVGLYILIWSGHVTFYLEDKRKWDVTDILFILDCESEELFQSPSIYSGSSLLPLVRLVLFFETGEIK